MWKVTFESKELEKESQRRILSGEFTNAERTIIQSWIRQITFNGPESIQRSKLWNDHALERDWYGYRSSSFSNRGRIIYKIEGDKIVIKIARITKSHDYSKEQED